MEQLLWTLIWEQKGYIDFYTRVKTLAKKNKTTIEYIVGQAGLSVASYNAYRHHENLPRADEAQKIAQALGTTVEYLVSGNSPEPATAEDALSEIGIILDQYKKSRRKNP